MSRETIEVDGRRRTYLHIAPHRTAPTAPLIVALHGTTQNAKAMRKFSGGTIDDLAEKIGADLVYLNGYRRAWNDPRRIKTSAAQKRDMDDVRFVRDVVERFAKPAVVVGYSNGGQLVHRLLREVPETFVGAVVIAAGLPVDEDFTLAGVAPARIPMLLFHGTGDPVVPYEGGVTKLLGRTRGTVRSALDTALSYAPAGEPAVVRSGDVERRDWDGVRLISQIGAGHVIPNLKTSPSPRFVGPSHHDIDTGEEIREFLHL
ncbi:alpha/beta hydrolase family esterase [Streptomyces sp. NBC_00370]|uniref:alpha/beta hydrolase family esterase n=1 Tax=Streptomyces sp. NBC_00370 TaxID=2975728 RepID=UPI002E26CD6B